MGKRTSRVSKFLDSKEIRKHFGIINAGMEKLEGH